MRLAFGVLTHPYFLIYNYTTFHAKSQIFFCRASSRGVGSDAPRKLPSFSLIVNSNYLSIPKFIVECARILKAYLSVNQKRSGGLKTKYCFQALCAWNGGIDRKAKCIETHRKKSEIDRNASKKQAYIESVKTLPNVPDKTQIGSSGARHGGGGGGGVKAWTCQYGVISVLAFQGARSRLEKKHNAGGGEA